MSGFSKADRAEAARTGKSLRSIYDARRAAELGISKAQARGKPKKGEPSVTQLRSTGKLPKARGAKPGQRRRTPAQRPQRAPRRTVTPAADIYRSTSERSIWQALHDAARLGLRVDLEVTYTSGPPQPRYWVLSSENIEGDSEPPEYGDPASRPAVAFVWHPRAGMTGIPASSFLAQLRSHGLKTKGAGLFDAFQAWWHEQWEAHHGRR